MHIGEYIEHLVDLFSKIASFLKLSHKWELSIDNLSMIKGGGIIAYLSVENEDGLRFSDTQPVMFPDEEGLFTAYGEKFVSPLVVVPMIVKKEEEKGVEKTVYYNHEEEVIFKSDFIGVNLRKAVVTPFYSLFIVHQILNKIIRVERGEDLKSFRLSGIAKAYGSEKSVNIYLTYEREENNGEAACMRFISAKGKMLEKYTPLNELEEKYLKRKLLIPLEEVNENMRLPNETHIGIVDLFETPESEKIGLSLALVDERVYDFKTNSLKPCDKKLGHATSQIPFILHSDGARILMGAKNMKQALPVEGSEEPIVKTKDSDLRSGVNALVVYSLFYGYNFEDGVVISESFARKLNSIVEREERILVNAPMIGEPAIHDENSKWQLIVKWEASKKKNAKYKSALTEIVINKRHYKRGEDKVGRVSVNIEGQKETLKENIDLKLKIPYEFDILEVEPDIIQTQKTFSAGQNKKPSDNIFTLTLKLKVRIYKDFRIGDKITGRHGNKGVVSLILKDDLMPKVLMNGKELTADAVISPLSVVSRMNLSQLYETHIGAAIKFGKWDEEVFDCFYRFDSKKRKKLLKSLKELGSDEYGRFEVVIKDPFDGKAKPSKIKATAGWQYILRLDHSSPEKFHYIGEISDEALKKIIERELSQEESEDLSVLKPKQLGLTRTSFNTITLMPHKGKRRAGGQKVGEMEFWALFSHGAYSITERIVDRNKENFSKIVPLSHLTPINAFVKEYIKAENKGKDKKLNRFLNIEVADGASKKTIVKVLSIRSKPIGNMWKSLEEYFKTVRELALTTKSLTVFKNLFKKEGYIRGVSVTRRIYNSGRMVIVPRPDLNVYELILPKELKKIGIKKGDIVLVNRQPTLHIHSLQAFKVKGFWNEYALGFPILACKGFNADFDGDTVALYFIKNPTEKIKKELESMLPINIPFLLGSGSLAWSVDQDIICGFEKNKKEAISYVEDLVKQGKYKKAFKEIKAAIKKATENGLTLSVFEIEKDEGSFRRIKDLKCRGSKEQWEQLNRGIKINGVLNEKETFIKGISEKTFLEFISLRARKSLMDKKLHVADAGHFTRYLVELLGDVKISEKGTPGKLKYTKEDIEVLKEREILDLALLGRVTSDGEVINEETLEKIRKFSGEVEILSPIESDVTKESLGINPSALDGDWKTKHIGVAAATTIGERGTQLSMQTFHTGGHGESFSMEKIKRYIINSILQSIIESSDVQSAFKSFILKMTDVKDKDIKSMLGKSDNLNLIKDFFKARLVFFEVLFRKFYDILSENDNLKKSKIEKIREKIGKWLKDHEGRGILTTISFENGGEIVKRIVKNSKAGVEFETTETHPRVLYPFKLEGGGK